LYSQTPPKINKITTKEKTASEQNKITMTNNGARIRPVSHLFTNEFAVLDIKSNLNFLIYGSD
jgi:CRISPR/Cas system CSM-associated protein Csm4 (group 5 of RAMP superfamily)